MSHLLSSGTFVLLCNHLIDTFLHTLTHWVQGFLKLQKSLWGGPISFPLWHRLNCSSGPQMNKLCPWHPSSHNGCMGNPILYLFWSTLWPLKEYVQLCVVWIYIHHVVLITQHQLSHHCHSQILLSVHHIQTSHLK